MATTGTWIRVTPPPEVDAAGARDFWAALGELRRRGEPWVVWHFQATGGAGAGVWLWVPQVIPVENVRRAVQGAWPKARTEESAPPPIEAPKLPSRREMAAERDRYRRAAGLAGAAGILSVGVHSFVDFGLQITGIAVVFAALIVITIVKCGHDSADRPKGPTAGADRVLIPAVVPPATRARPA